MANLAKLIRTNKLEQKKNLIPYKQWIKWIKRGAEVPGNTLSYLRVSEFTYIFFLCQVCQCWKSLQHWARCGLRYHTTRNAPLVQSMNNTRKMSQKIWEERKVSVCGYDFRLVHTVLANSPWAPNVMPLFSICNSTFPRRRLHRPRSTKYYN